MENKEASAVPEFNRIVSNIQQTVDTAEKSAEVIYQLISKLDYIDDKPNDSKISEPTVKRSDTHLTNLREIEKRMQCLNDKTFQLIQHLEKLI